MIERNRGAGYFRSGGQGKLLWAFEFERLDWNPKTGHAARSS